MKLIFELGRNCHISISNHDPINLETKCV